MLASPSLHRSILSPFIVPSLNLPCSGDCLHARRVPRCGSPRTWFWVVRTASNGLGNVPSFPLSFFVYKTTVLCEFLVPSTVVSRGDTLEGSRRRGNGVRRGEGVGRVQLVRAAAGAKCQQWRPRRHIRGFCRLLFLYISGSDHFNIILMLR